jgi:hypothetical protein
MNPHGGENHTNELGLLIERAIQANLEYASCSGIAGHVPSRPSIPATQEGVCLAERPLQRNLPSDYRQFLMMSDGWEDVSLVTSMRGTNDLVHGRFLSKLTLPGFWVDLGSEFDLPGNVVVVGGCDYTRLVIVWLDRGPSGSGYYEYDREIFLESITRLLICSDR